MRKIYKCSNIKFCMEDENQRRTWEYLQGMTRKDGSYGKILSDAFAAVLDGHVQSETNGVVRDSAILSGQDTDILGKMLDRVLEEKFHEMLPKLQEAFAEQISRVFREYVSDFHSGVDASADTDRMGQMHESELSEDMMAFAFAMGE